MTGVLRAMVKRRQWIHYLTRPFTLFGCSLWQAWYHSEEPKKCFGVSIKDALFVEERSDVFRCYRDREQHQKFRDAMRHVVEHNVPRARKLLSESESYNRQALAVLRGGKRPRTLAEAVSFLTAMAMRATVFPFFAGQVLAEKSSVDSTLTRQLNRLRRVSYYPRYIDEVVMPLVVAELKKRGARDAKHVSTFLTIREILAGDFSALAKRQVSKKAGKWFVYETLNGKETIVAVTSVDPIVHALEPELAEASDIIRGSVAYPGKVRGRVRIVDARQWKTAIFKRGDILVSINTNPTLMPLIKKASALIADEGGVMSHAAIIARELKIPCIMGTKRATGVLCDGEMVEVDAEKGIIKKL